MKNYKVYFTQENKVASLSSEPGYIEKNLYTLIGETKATGNFEAIQNLMGDSMLPVFQELNIGYKQLPVTMRPANINVMFKNLVHHASNYIAEELPKKDPEDENEKVKYKGLPPVDPDNFVHLIYYLRDIQDITSLFNTSTQPVLISSLSEEEEDVDNTDNSTEEVEPTTDTK